MLNPENYEKEVDLHTVNPTATCDGCGQPIETWLQMPLNSHDDTVLAKCGSWRCVALLLQRIEC